MPGEIRLVTVGDSAPDFTYRDIDGNEVSLSDHRGSYVFIDVWATWCVPCKEQIPYIRELEKKLEGKEIVFVSISCDKDKEKWSQMVRQEKLSGIQLNTGGSSDFMNAFGIRGIPRFILIDKEGRVMDPNMAAPSNSEVAEYLTSLE